jgi:hypothetical protein
MPAVQQGQPLPPRHEQMGAALLRSRRYPPAHQGEVPDQERGTGALPRRHRAAAARRNPGRALRLSAFVDVFLDRHVARARTSDTLRERLARPEATFGDVDLRDLEPMTSEIAAWYAKLPERSPYGVMARVPPMPRCRRPLAADDDEPRRRGRSRTGSRRPARSASTPSTNSAPSPPNSPPRTGSFRRSAPRPACALRNGPRSNATPLTSATAC